MQLKRALSAVMTIIIVLTSVSFPVSAADNDRIAKVDAKIKKLEEKYNIGIKYDLNENGNPSIGTGTLTMLDKSLEYVTPEVVKQVSSYYEEKLGQKITYQFVYNPYKDQIPKGQALLGMFNTETAEIQLFLANSPQNTFMTGDSPLTIVHEFAHAMHFMIMDKYGEAKLAKEWKKLNNGVPYNGNQFVFFYNKVTFISDYGATMYEEDFAEVVAHAFVRNKDGQGFKHRLKTNDNLTALGKKIDYIEKLLPKVFKNTDKAVKNIHRVFSTATTLEYQDVKILGDGEELQYIGFTYPLYVLKGILSMNKIKANTEDCHWITEIGGWHVKDTGGKAYLVFPGGVEQALDKPLKIKSK